MRFFPFTLPLLFYSLLPVCSQSAVPDSLITPVHYDTSYIFDYKNVLSARFYGLFQDTRLVIYQKESGNIVFKPNLPFKVGIAGFYKWFGLGLSMYSPVSTIDKAKEGKTSAIDLRLNIYSNVFALEGHLQRIRGLYISNFPGPDDNHFTNPGFTVHSIGINGYYIQNYRRFSFRSAYFENEWQRRNAGSFISCLSVNVSALDGSGNMIPDDFMHLYDFDSLKNFSKATLVSVSLSPGYAYNLVFLKKCFFHVTGFAGPAYNVMSDRSISMGEKLDVFSLLLSFRGALGYNGKKFHTGISAIFGGLQPFASEKYNFYIDPPQLRIWVGTRFDIFKKKNKKNVVPLPPEIQE